MAFASLVPRRCDVREARPVHTSNARACETTQSQSRSDEEFFGGAPVERARREAILPASADPASRARPRHRACARWHKPRAFRSIPGIGSIAFRARVLLAVRATPPQRMTTRVVVSLSARHGAVHQGGGRRQARRPHPRPSQWPEGPRFISTNGGTLSSTGLVRFACLIRTGCGYSRRMSRNELRPSFFKKNPAALYWGALSLGLVAACASTDQSGSLPPDVSGPSSNRAGDSTGQGGSSVAANPASAGAGTGSGAASAGSGMQAPGAGGNASAIGTGGGASTVGTGGISSTVGAGGSASTVGSGGANPGNGEGSGGRGTGGRRFGSGGSEPGNGGTPGAGGANGADAGASGCTNNRKDGKETDVDCGGGDCPACENGKKCQEAADCLGGECRSLIKVCDS